jgi:hypothetical protein
MRNNWDLSGRVSRDFRSRQSSPSMKYLVIDTKSEKIPINIELYYNSKKIITGKVDLKNNFTNNLIINGKPVNGKVNLKEWNSSESVDYLEADILEKDEPIQTRRYIFIKPDSFIISDSLHSPKMKALGSLNFVNTLFEKGNVQGVLRAKFTLNYPLFEFNVRSVYRQREMQIIGLYPVIWEAESFKSNIDKENINSLRYPVGSEIGMRNFNLLLKPSSDKQPVASAELLTIDKNKRTMQLNEAVGGFVIKKDLIGRDMEEYLSIVYEKSDRKKVEYICNNYITDAKILFIDKFKSRPLIGKVTKEDAEKDLKERLKDKREPGYLNKIVIKDGKFLKYNEKVILEADKKLNNITIEYGEEEIKIVCDTKTNLKVYGKNWGRKDYKEVVVNGEKKDFEKKDGYILMAF